MSAPLLQDPSLTWGVLSLVGPGESEAQFDIEAISEGSTFGDPVPVIETMQSLLIDGALEETVEWENREVVLPIRVSANDGEAASEAEAELFRQRLLDQPPPLVWTSPMGLSATSVFDVVAADLRRDYRDGWDSVDEMLNGYRYYTLTLRCLPFARAVESTIVPALPVPVDPEVEDWTDVDTVTSAAGWSRETNGGFPTGPTYAAGPPSSIAVSAFIDNPNDHLRLVRTGAIAVPTDYYLVVDVALETASALVTGQWKIHDGSVYRNPVAIVSGGGEDGSTRLYFDALPAAISDLKILYDFATAPSPHFGSTEVTLRVYNVAYTDTIGSSTTTTNRQQSRLAAVAGTAPTQAQVRLYDANPADLGTDILVYTTRVTDWRPNLRTWISDGEIPATDTAMVSGSRHTLATPTTLRIPANLLLAGSYALLARMNVPVAGTLTWQARMTTLGGAALVGSDVVVSGEVDLAVTSGYEVVDLAAMILPVVEVEGSGYAVELTLTGTVNMSLDEAWLFSLDDGALTWVRDTEGLDWIEIRSPELGAARPSVWGGRNLVGTGASCIDWKCLSFGSHRFEPGTMQIFTVTSTSLESQAEIEFFPRAGWNIRGAETS